jgi:hypothetical protein
MRRVVLSCVFFAVLLLPAATSARATPLGAKPGYLVVQKGANDGGEHGRPAITLVMQGFVLGRVTQQARVEIYHLPSTTGQTSAKGEDVSPPQPVRLHKLPGVAYTGSGFRFSAVGGFYRVVIRGSGVYLYAGGVQGKVTLQGSSIYKNKDGTYSINGSRPRSLPTERLSRTIPPK